MEVERRGANVLDGYVPKTLAEVDRFINKERRVENRTLLAVLKEELVYKRRMRLLLFTSVLFVLMFFGTYVYFVSGM